MGAASGSGRLSGQAGVRSGAGREGTGPRWHYDRHAVGTDLSLRSLRDRPFELLKELEKRSRSVTAGNAPEAAAGLEGLESRSAWVARHFWWRREETREVLGYPAVITRIPGAGTGSKGWRIFAASCCPLLDLRQFLGAERRCRGAIPASSWPITGRIPAGLIVDEVLGFRRFADPEFNPEPPPTVIRCDSYLAAPFGAAARCGRCSV